MQTGAEQGIYLVAVAGSDSDTPGRRFAKEIRDARARLGWTQDDLIEESGVSRATILRYEAGDVRKPEPENIRAVCTALGIDPREAIIALGYLTRDELGMPPREPRIDPLIARAARLLADKTVPDEMKDLLRKAITDAVDLWDRFRATVIEDRGPDAPPPTRIPQPKGRRPTH